MIFFLVLVLMLLEVQWRPVVPAPTDASRDCELNNTKSLTQLLEHQTNELLDEYVSTAQ